MDENNEYIVLAMHNIIVIHSYVIICAILLVMLFIYQYTVVSYTDLFYLWPADTE